MYHVVIANFVLLLTLSLVSSFSSTHPQFMMMRFSAITLRRRNSISCVITDKSVFRPLPRHGNKYCSSKNSCRNLVRRYYFTPSSLSSSPNDDGYDIENSEKRHNDQHHQQHSLQNGSLRQKLRSGSSPTVGVVSGFYKDTDHVEILGLLGGYDFLWADAEHSSASPDHIASQIVAAERRGMPTLVRIGYGYQHIIGHAQKYLVAGAQGIILPQCESKSDVERIVEAVKFPPLGKRGLAGERWNSWGLGEGSTLAERVRVSNENSIVAVIIENQAGIDNLSEILSVDEIDFVFVAPTDLSSNMGYPGDIRHPEVIAKIEAIGERIREANKSAGMLALSVQDYSYWRKRGFQVMCCVAHTMFIDGAKGIMEGISNYENSHTD